MHDAYMGGLCPDFDLALADVSPRLPAGTAVLLKPFHHGARIVFLWPEPVTLPGEVQVSLKLALKNAEFGLATDLSRVTARETHQIPAGGAGVLHVGTEGLTQKEVTLTRGFQVCVDQGSPFVSQADSRRPRQHASIPCTVEYPVLKGLDLPSLHQGVLLSLRARREELSGMGCDVQIRFSPMSAVWNYYVIAPPTASMATTLVSGAGSETSKQHVEFTQYNHVDEDPIHRRLSAQWSPARVIVYRSKGAIPWIQGGLPHVQLLREGREPLDLPPPSPRGGLMRNSKVELYEIVRI